MENTTPASKGRLNPLTVLLDLLDRVISARADAEARRRGHTVTRVPGSRTHVYRDPRWDARRQAMLDGTDPESATPDLSEQPS